MHFSSATLIIFALAPAFGIAAPAASSSGKGAGAVKATSTSKAAAPAAATGDATAAGAANGVSDKQVANAVLSWMNDTGKVTKFLNTATSFTGDEFTRQATVAFNAEVDELNHKAILDSAFGQTDVVKAANDTLATKGNFQAVVDALQSMMVNGPDDAQAQVDVINANRCVNVLPNIDAYFSAAGSPTVKSVVPTGCLEIAGANSSSAATAPDANAQAAAADSSSSTTAKPSPATSAPASKATTGAAKASSASTSSAAAAEGTSDSTAGAGAPAKPDSAASASPKKPAATAKPAQGSGLATAKAAQGSGASTANTAASDAEPAAKKGSKAAEIAKAFF